MDIEKAEQRHKEIVKDYFAYIKDLRAKKEGAVEKLLKLWDDDGIFEFCGAQPVTGTFCGKSAIHALYKNRFHSSGMSLRLEGNSPKAKREVALGVVDTDVNRTKMLDKKIVAGWTTTIGTTDGQGFQVAGSHTFTFKNGNIGSLKVVISPKADVAPNLTLEGLAVDDIGRLALAAWPVV